MSKESKDLAAKAQWDSKRVLSLVVNNALMIIMIIAAIAIAIVNPNFVSASSIVNIISQTAAYLPAALGIAGCIVLTGTDLSAGRAVGLTACISASLLQVAGSASKMWPNIGTLPIPVVILIAMAIGAVIGAFNGFFVGKFKLHPFIVTLGTQLILYTILLLYVKMGNNGGMAISNLDESYNSFVKGSILPKIAGQTIPNYVIFAILLTALMWFIWNKTTFGKNMFASWRSPGRRRWRGRAGFRLCQKRPPVSRGRFLLIICSTCEYTTGGRRRQTLCGEYLARSSGQGCFWRIHRKNREIFMKKRELSIDILRPVGYTGLACAGLSCRHCDDAGDCGASR